MNEALLSRTATLVRAAQLGTRDRGGNPTWQDTPPVSVRCYIEQRQAEEITVGQTTFISTHLGVFPAGAEFDGSDRLTVDGVTYRVVGEPWAVWNPVHGAVDHIEANLQVIS